MANLQDTVKNLINNEILACQSSLVDNLLSKEVEGFEIDNIENLDRATYPNQYVYRITLNTGKAFTATLFGVNEETGETFEKYRVTNEIYQKNKDIYDFKDVDDVAEYFDISGTIHEDIDDIEPEYEPNEIFEWWLVGGRLADDLRDIGAPILDNEYGIWWGRTETGQSLELDSDLNRVAENLIERTKNF